MEQIKGIKVNGTQYAVNASNIETHVVSPNGVDFLIKVDEKGGVYGYKAGVNESYPYIPTSTQPTDSSSASNFSGTELSMSDVNMDASARQYTVSVADGDLKVRETLGTKHAASTSNYANSTSETKFALTINEIYANDTQAYLDNPKHNINIPVSHNFVEIANLDPNKTISLENVSLQYYNAAEASSTDATKGWHILQLHGHINPGSTFLIRGAQVANQDAPSTIINVDTFDMEWYENGKLMAFNNTKGTLYLSHDSVIFPNSDFVKNNGGVDTSVYDFSLAANQNPAALCKYTKGSTTYNILPNTYLDEIGWGTGAFAEVDILSGVTENTLIVRRNMLDRAKQAIPTTLDARTNKVGKFVELVDLSKTNMGNEASFKPCCVAENKNIYTTRSDMREQRPYCVTVTFGIDATKTRCFNWVSPGIDDEFIFYRKKGETTWTIKQSYKEGDGQDADIREKVMNYLPYTDASTGTEVQDTYSMHLPFYDRVYWETSGGRFVTSHKVILRNLENALTYYTDNTLTTQSETETEFTKGQVYEYCVGRAEYNRYKKATGPDEEHCSPVYEFQVRPSVNKTWRFIQHTDEQGFNDCEYQVWRRTANIIRAQFNPQFTIDTGDMTQNGNRLSEWLDYNTGVEALSQGLKQTYTLNGSKVITNESAGVEQMNVVGNNDLSPIYDYVLGSGGDATATTDMDGKVSTKQFKYFYCYEIDVDNMPATIAAKETKSTTKNHTDEYEMEVKSWIPSCYSFNYNNCHFTAICSEITASSAVNEFGETADPDDADKKKLLTYSKTFDLIEDWVQADLNKWYALSLNPATTATYPWSICYMHEMPWTILTTSFAGSSDDSEYIRDGGCKLNDFGTQKFHMSEIFQNNRVRLVIGGHKHTHSHSWPIGENIVYNLGTVSEPNLKFSWELTNDQLNDDAIKATRTVSSKKTIVYLPYNTDSSILSNYKTIMTSETPVAVGNISFPIRFQYNSEIYHVTEDKENWLPVYVMSQASANKVKSNKEMPADSIPYLRYYYPENETNAAVSDDQKFPHFVEYEFVQDASGNARDLNIRHYKVNIKKGFADGQAYSKIYGADESKDAFATGANMKYNNTEDKSLAINSSDLNSVTDSYNAPIAQTLKWISRDDTRTLNAESIEDWTENLSLGNLETVFNASQGEEVTILN